MDRLDSPEQSPVGGVPTGPRPPAFRLLGGEFLATGLQRVSLEQLDYAIRTLEDSPLDVGIHEARKAMRRVRAILRLVRDPLGDRVYFAENIALRDTGRIIGGSRDATVLVETVHGLSFLYSDVVHVNAYEQLLEHLGERDELIRRRITASTVHDVIGRLQASRNRFAAWPARFGEAGPVADDFATVRRGIRRVYRRGRRRMADAALVRTSSAHHVWRKRVRYLRFQMELLEGMWPRMQRGLARDLAFLADVLGAEHDLAMLENLLAYEPEMLPDDAARQVLGDLVTRNRLRLQDAARPVGQRVYAEEPDVFVDRLASYWRVWRSPPIAAFRPPSAAWLIRTVPGTPR